TANRLQLDCVEPVNLERDEAICHASAMAASASGGTKTTEALVAAGGGAPQTVVDEVVFSSKRKWSAVALDGPEMRGVFALGAPGMLLAVLDDAGSTEAPEGWTEQGRRVLLFAWQPDPVPLHDEGGAPRLPPGLRPAAWFGFTDELRPHSRKTIA